ncbi:hypothetical protein H0K60_004474 [Salmonella enterica]|nr:hypothetical protein [Salmonella enterica]EFR2649718.1 hypothetical protein [Salmonella enterica]EFS1408067.1 hypothetical protein [Salmonella enterica]EHQ8162514.1 hypothetical protein [Salmonella enterica]EJZ9218167.1 hypothetical protein [Salmonella enterica]
MSPLVIDGHDKNLIWPEDLDEPGQSYQKLANTKDDDGDEHEVILEDDGGEMARLYLRHIKTGTVSANFLLEFALTPPEGLPDRIPQVTSAFVGVDYRRVRLSQHVYRLIMGHYGVVVSDTHQTAGGMYIWLYMAMGNDVQINIMKVRNDTLEYRLNDAGEPEAYCGQIDQLEQAGNTIWGGPEVVTNNLDLERLGFRPTHIDMSHIVLAARKA